MNVPKLRIHPRGKMEASHLWACVLFKAFTYKKRNLLKGHFTLKRKARMKKNERERRSIVPANTFSAQWYTTFRNCKCGRRSINLLVTVVVNEQEPFLGFWRRLQAASRLKMLLTLGLRTGKGQGGDPKIRWYLVQVLTYIRSDDYNNAHVRVTPIWLSGHHEDAEGLGNLHKSAGH